MKSTLRLLCAALALCASAFAQTGYTTVSAAHLQDATGTLLANATITFTPTNNAGGAISFRVGGAGGQSIGYPVSTLVTNGVFSISLADTTLTDPVNVCYAVTLTSNISGKALPFPGYNCIQPSGSTWNFDTYVPDSAPNAIVVVGPTGPVGPACATGSGTCNMTVPISLPNDTFLPPQLSPDTPAQADLTATKVYADTVQIVAHREYLSHAHKLLMAKTGVPLKITFSGDSTTAGDFTTAPYRITDVVQSILNSRGIPAVITNAGHSGNTTAQWLSTWIPADMAAPPDIYVVRWGMNDPYCASTCTQSAATDLANAQLTASEIRTGLATIRASYNVAQMSILLMSPNMASDTPHGRTPGYFQQLFPLLRQAAIDYQCEYIDTPDFLQDMGSANSSDWINADYSGSAYHVHPLNVMNTWLGSLIADALFPSYYTQNVTNTYYPVAQHAASDAPSTYEDGISIHPAINSGATNWAFTGLVETTNQSTTAGNYAMQINWASNANSLVAFRMWAAAVGTWSPWAYAGSTVSIPSAALTLSNSWANFGGGSATAAARMDGGVVRLSGLIAGGTTTTLTTIATLPAALWPAANRWFTVPFSPTANTNGTAIIVVTSAGAVQIYAAPTGGSYLLSLDPVSFIP